MGLKSRLLGKGSKPAVSIDIGHNEIKVAVGMGNSKGVSVKDLFSFETPEGSYEDGMIKNTEILSKHIKKELAVNGVDTENAHLVVNSSRIITREIDIPKVKSSEIESLVNFQLGNYIPVNPDDYTARVLFLENVEKEGAELMKMLLIGIPSEIVSGHLNLIERAGLKPMYMDYQGNAVRKALASSTLINGKDMAGKTLVVVDIGSNSTSISIVTDDKLRVSRIVEIGYRETETGSNIIDICDRIGMVIKYFTSREGSNNSVDYIMVHGGNIQDNVRASIEANLEIETGLINSLEGVSNDTNLCKYVNAIGGLIRLEDR